jgi:hypothetical protein
LTVLYCVKSAVKTLCDNYHQREEECEQSTPYFLFKPVTSL